MGKEVERSWIRRLAGSAILLLILLILWTTGMWRYIIAFFMDILAILAAQFGLDMGLGFVENTLSVWPGGEIAYKIWAHDMPNFFNFVFGAFQIFIVCTIRSAFTPIEKMQKYQDRRYKWRIFKFFKAGALDAALTGAIALFVGVLTNYGFNRLLNTQVQFALIIFLCGLLTIAFPVIVLVLLGKLKKIFLKPSQAFALITALARFSLVTFSLIAWSTNPTLGCGVILLTVIACAFLTLMDAGFPFKIYD